MVLHIILRHFKGKLVVCSCCQLLISINVSSKIKINYFFIICVCVCVCIDQFLWRIITFKNLFNHSTIQSYYRRFDQSISWPINEPFIPWNKHQAVIKKLSKSTDPSIHPLSIHNKKLINWSIHPSQHPFISTSIHSSVHHLSIHPSISWVWYLGRNVDRQYLLSSTPVGVFSLVGVSAEFGT